MAALDAIVAHLDALLDTPGTPDYDGALNGLQCENRGGVRGVAAAVDYSQRAIDGAVAAGADLLLVHHGMFWSGAQPIRGAAAQRLRALLAGDLAVYSSHLPLDRHPAHGNNTLLAQELGLTVAGEFGRYRTIRVGVRGACDLATAELVDRAAAFAGARGGRAVATAFVAGRRTRRWAIVTGAGASSDTLAEARETAAAGDAGGPIDTLIVGEGPHWTAVEAEQAGLVIIYAGHYATETLGVRSLARHVGERFGIPWTFVDAPTGL
jgi:dinuclear metal center YbgI/SA1388 family protein